jgi:YegS/Rv2252/BmrU family lipid kinase
MTAVLLIANADAGASDQTSVQAAIDELASHDVDVDLAATRGASDLEAALEGRGARDVVVAGGDGSLHAVVGALVRRGELRETTLGLIPLGTGNDFARSLDIPLNPADAAAAWVGGAARALDVMIDDGGDVVVNAVNIGIGADATRRAARLKPWFGRAAYALGAIGAGLRSRGRRLRVEIDGRALADGSRRVLQVGVGNGQFVGGGTPLLPAARPADGLVDVVVSFAVGARRVAYALQVERRTHVDRADVVSARAAAVRVRGDAFWCSADGELSGPHTDRTWRVRPRALTMRLPAPTRLG